MAISSLLEASETNEAATIRELILDAQRTLRPAAIRSFFDEDHRFWQVMSAVERAAASNDPADSKFSLRLESRTTAVLLEDLSPGWLGYSEADFADALANGKPRPADMSEIDSDKRLRRERIEQLARLQRALEEGALSPRLALHQVVGVCVQAQLFHLLTSHRVAHPTYNYLRAYDCSPLPWDSPRDVRPIGQPAWRVLGFDVFFPIGIPASVLTANAQWIRYYADRGFNVLTFKTVRTHKRPPHVPPNWLFVDGFTTPLAPNSPRVGLTVAASEAIWPELPDQFSMVNSFGVPSADPSEWMLELEAALREVGPGRVLIASVIGDEQLESFNATVNDYARAARMAKECGAQAIELNLSCPNTIQDGKVKVDMIGSQPEATAAVVQAVRAAIGNEIRLVIKLHYMPLEQLESVLAASHRFVDGVAGINTLQVEIRSPAVEPVFPGRDKAGLSGVAIRDLGLEFAANALIIRDRLSRTEDDFSIIAMGGVMNADDVERYRSLGVSAVQTATAAFFNADLAAEVARRYRSQAQTTMELRAEGRTLEELMRGPRPFKELIAILADEFKPTSLEVAGQVRGILRRMEAKGLITSTYQNGRLTFENRTTGDRLAQVVR